MGKKVDDAAVDALFREARTYSKWQAKPVSDQMLHDLYELVKWAPTSANAGPGRFVFLRSKESKERLRPALAPMNVEKTMTAPITVIVAYDLRFYTQLPKLFPHADARSWFIGNQKLIDDVRKATGLPTTSMSTAVIEGLKAVKARRIAVATACASISPTAGSG